MADRSGTTRKVLRTIPGLRSSYHRGRYMLWRERIRLRGRSTMKGLIDPLRTLSVDPKDIRLACVWGPESYRKFGDRGKVLGGSWDEQVEEFESLDVYRGMREHFIDGRPWSETDYYHRVLGQVLSGSRKRGMISREDVDERCAFLDRLYQQIRDEGYKPLTTVKGRPVKWTTAEDEVSVRIGRHGDLLFEDGRHRLAIAKLLGIDRIPVKVTVRHRQWFDFLREVRAYARTHGGSVRNTISHPDLDDVPALHGTELLELIEGSLPSARGTALDVGCHWGYYCQRLEELGFHCVGIEADPQAFHFASKLRRAARMDYDLMNTSFHDYRGRTQFDLVLALDVFDRFTRTQEQHRRFTETLGRLEMGAMILGCHNDDQPSTQKAGRDRKPQELVDLILSHSNLSQARQIGTEDGGRDIYLLEA